MTRTTEPQRAPTLDDILERLAELAPAPDASASAPVPESTQSRRAAILDVERDLDRVGGATEPASVRAATSGAEQGADRPVIDLRTRTGATTAAVQSRATETRAGSTETATSGKSPSPAAGHPPVPPVDISSREPAGPQPAADRTATSPRSAARPGNPFKKLVIWSLVLGLGLLVGALLLLVT